MATTVDDINLRPLGQRATESLDNVATSAYYLSSSASNASNATSRTPNSSNEPSEEGAGSTMVTLASRNPIDPENGGDTVTGQRLRPIFGKNSCLRKWKFYKRLCTVPNLCIGVLTFVLGYRSLAYLHYQSMSIFRADCMARRDHNLTLSQDCERELNHSMRRPHPTWGRLILADYGSEERYDPTSWEIVLFSDARRPEPGIMITSLLILPGVVLLNMGPMIFLFHRFTFRQLCLAYLLYTTTNLTDIWFSFSVGLLSQCNQLNDWLWKHEKSSFLWMTYFTFALMLPALPLTLLNFEHVLFMTLQAHIFVIAGTLYAYVILGPEAIIWPATLLAQVCIFRIFKRFKLRSEQTQMLILVHALLLAVLAYYTRILAWTLFHKHSEQGTLPPVPVLRGPYL